MFEIPSPASSSSDGEEDLLSFEELLDEASMDAHSAANTCSCGEHPVMMAVVGLIASGCVVKAAAGIVGVLDRCHSCQCRESQSLLTGALDAVVQLGVQLGETQEEREQLLHMQRVAAMLTRVEITHSHLTCQVRRHLHSQLT